MGAWNFFILLVINSLLLGNMKQNKVYHMCTAFICKYVDGISCDSFGDVSVLWDHIMQSKVSQCGV